MERPTDAAGPRAGQDRNQIAISPRTLVLFVGIALAGLLVLAGAYVVRSVLVQLVVAIVLAMAAEPAVRSFQRRGLGRNAAVVITFLLLLLLLIVFAYLLIKPLYDETRTFARNAPALIQDLTHGKGRVGFLERRFHIVEHAQDAVDSGKLSATAGPAWGVVNSAIHTVASAVFVLFLSLFVLLGGRQWFDSILDLFRDTTRARLRRTGDGIATAVAGYVTGNLLISVIAGSVTTVVLYAASVPYPIALGLLVAIFDLIPMVGATIGTVLVGLVALGTQGWVTAAIVVAAMIIYQQIENNLLQQLVYHRTVKLSPLAIALSVAIGAELAGVPGALLGIPFASSIKVVSRELLAWRRGLDAPPPLA